MLNGVDGSVPARLCLAVRPERRRWDTFAITRRSSGFPHRTRWKKRLSRPWKWSRKNDKQSLVHERGVFNLYKCDITVRAVSLAVGAESDSAPTYRQRYRPCPNVLFVCCGCFV